MYDFIRGPLIELVPGSAVLDAGGVGYRVFIPVKSFGKMPPLKQEVLLYTSFVIRENSQSLFGFLTKPERDLFEQLLAISGVGPKTAISLVGHLDYNDLISSIQGSDAHSLCKVPGIGKKTADRIILEVKDKLSTILIDEDSIASRDATRALVNLGYSQAIAQKAVQSALKGEKDLDLSQLLTQALKCL